MSTADRLRCDIPADWGADFSQCLFEWQGLESGALALLAALLGIKYIWKQIQQSEKHRADEIRRRHNAARVALPMALAEISAYVQSITDNLADELEKYDQDNPNEPMEELARRGFGVEGLPSVKLPKEVIPAFQIFVETLDDEAAIRHIAELLSSIQIMQARYDGLDFEQVAMKFTLYGRLMDAAKVGFLNDRLYNYSRFLEQKDFAVVGVLSLDEAWTGIHGKAQGLLFSRDSPDFFFGELQKRVDGYKKSMASPWLEKMDA